MKKLFIAGLAAVFGASAHAAEPADRELGLLLGGSLVDSDLSGSLDDSLQPLIGIRYAHRLGTSTSFFSDLTFANVDGNRAGVGDSDIATLRGGMEWLFSRQPRYNWFLSGGLGAMSINTDNGPDFTRPLLSLGVGQDWGTGPSDGFRWEIRADQSIGNDGLPGSGLTNLQALLGYSWGVGAPADTDTDGVPDRRDLCPGTAAGTRVDGKGCELDSDGDGLGDEGDKCPTEFAKTFDGCPAPAQVPPPAATAAPEKLVLQGVNFDNGLAGLRAEAKPILDSAADALKRWGDVKVEIAGHTDDRGDAASNLRLSQRRAEAVRGYLIGKGVDAARLSARGYGETRPIADNTSEQGRFKNRRVELIPQE